MFDREHAGAQFRYLPRAAVIRAIMEVDIVGTVRDALIQHARGASELPAEGYLGWETPLGFSARSIAMQDDLLPDVVERADAVFVDDWDLVSHDNRRLFGRTLRQGTLAAPGSAPSDTGSRSPRKVDETLGEMFAGTTSGRKADADVIVSNPFGMAIFDVTVAAAVQRVAVSRGYGLELPV